MAVGFDTMHARLVEIIRDAAVQTYDRDQPFVCVEDGEGVASDLEDVLVGDRFFDLRMDTPPYDAGYTGCNGFVNRTDMELRVRYNGGDRGRRTRKAGVDAGSITRALLNPCLWDSPNSGIDLVIPPSRDDVSVETEDDESQTVYLTLIFVVEYREHA